MALLLGLKLDAGSKMSKYVSKIGFDMFRMIKVAVRVLVLPLVATSGQNGNVRACWEICGSARLWRGVYPRQTITSQRRKIKCEYSNAKVLRNIDFMSGANFRRPVRGNT